jgi:hypothetical protein
MQHHTSHLVLFIFAALAALCSCQRAGNTQQVQLKDSANLLKDSSAPLTTEGAKSDSTQQEVLFAYADGSGCRLLGASPPLSHLPYFVIAPDGDATRLTYKGWRPESERSTGRQIAINFENDGGSLFSVDSCILVPDRTYLIVSQQFLLTHNSIHLVRRDYSSLDGTTSNSIAVARALRIQRSWRMVSLGSQGEVATVLFANTRPPLASLVLFNNGSLMYEDYPGDTTEEESTWRVGDDGMFDGKNIGVVAAFTSPEGVLIARIWQGAEGENAVLLRQSSTGFVPIIDSYRYWVPE